MSNKDLFKELYNKKINKKDNYNQILNKVESDNNKVKSINWILITMCFIMIFSIPQLKRFEDMNIEINKVSNSIKPDADIKIVNDVNISNIDIIVFRY